MNIAAQTEPFANPLRFSAGVPDGSFSITQVTPQVANLTFFASSKQRSALTFNAHGEQVVAIEQDGSIKWRGREVETDDEFKAAMLDLRAVLLNSKGVKS
jgi:hypothetical protein